VPCQSVEQPILSVIESTAGDVLYDDIAQWRPILSNDCLLSNLNECMIYEYIGCFDHVNEVHDLTSPVSSISVPTASFGSPCEDQVSTWSSPGDCNDAVIMPVNVLNNGECALGNSSDAVVIPVNAPDSNNAVKQNNNECEGQSCRQQLVALMTVPCSKTNKNRQLNSLFVTLEDYSRVTVIKFGLNDISRRQRRDTC